MTVHSDTQRYACGQETTVPQASTTTRLQRQLWVMLLALLSGFALSQAFRTITTIVALGLQQDFGISASS